MFVNGAKRDRPNRSILKGQERRGIHVTRRGHLSETLQACVKGPKKIITWTGPKIHEKGRAEKGSIKAKKYRKVYTN